MSCANEQGRCGGRQRGFTLLLTLLVLLVGASSVYLSARDPAAASRAAEPERKARLLQDARRALSAYALAGGSNHRPGALPCPDTTGDGIVNSGCGTEDGVYLGRLPWKTLELSPEHAHLWYAFDTDFRDHPAAEPINVALPGSMTRIDRATDMERPGFVAFLLDPGDPLDGQRGREAASGVDSDMLDQYFDLADNTDEDAIYIHCDGSGDCNDRVLGITVDRLLAGVQRRAIGAVRELLQDFHADKGYLPYAAEFSGGEGCDTGVTVGRVALEESDCGTGESLTVADFDPTPDASSNPEPLPGGTRDPYQWVTDNEWLDHIVYVVDMACTAGGAGCTAATLELDGETGRFMILAGAGRPLQTSDGVAVDQDREDPGSITDYLDSEKNTNGNGRFADAPPAANDNDVLTTFVPEP